MSLLRPLVLLVAWVRRLLGRRRARKLRALGLPTAAQAVAGLLPGPRPALPLALRVPGPLVPPEGTTEHWALPTGASTIRRPGRPPGRLLRLAALPPLRPPLDRFRPQRFGLDAEARPSVQRAAPSPALARPLRSQALETLDALGRRPPPPPRPDPGALRPAAFGLGPQLQPAPERAAAALRRRDAGRVLLPRALRVPWPADLGRARPAAFGLDERWRLAAEREVPELSSDRPLPPPPGRRLRPRTPLARAPLGRLRPGHFRIDPRTGKPANEEIVGPRTPLREVWINRDFERDKLELHWMARTWIMGLSSGPTELFVWWWIQTRSEELGAGEPVELKQDDLIGYKVFHDLKEQMLIRRDVTRDAVGPADGGFVFDTKKTPAIRVHTAGVRPRSLVPPTQWIPRADLSTEPPFEESRPAFDAYVQWRTLLDGLEER